MQDAQHSSNHDSNISKLIFRRFYRVSYFPFYFTIFREIIGGGDMSPGPPRLPGRDARAREALSHQCLNSACVLRIFSETIYSRG